MNKNVDSEIARPVVDKLYWLLLALLGVFLIWAGWWLLLWFWPFGQLPDLSKQSNFGEMFGGIEALFSAFAFAGLIYTIILQRKELTLQRLELQLTREELKRQADELAAQNRGATHERLYNENHVLLECLANNPTVRPFFYENRPFEQCTDHRQRWQVLLITEMYTCFMELIALSLPELPDDVREEWRRFIQGVYKMSGVVRNCLREHYGWYSPTLHKILSDIPEVELARLAALDLKPMIRLMTEDDLDAVMNMQPDVYEEDFYEDREILLNKLELYPKGCWVCTVGNQVAGYLFALPIEYKNPPAINTEIDKLSSSPDCYYIHDLAVHKAHRGKRIASLLMQKAIKYAQRNRFRQMTLIAVQNSESFWIKQGFKSVNVSKEHLSKLQTYGESALYMKRVFPDFE